MPALDHQTDMPVPHPEDANKAPKGGKKGKKATVNSKQANTAPNQPKRRAGRPPGSTKAAMEARQQAALANVEADPTDAALALVSLMHEKPQEKLIANAAEHETSTASGECFCSSPTRN